jgi:WD40 repeat protein
MFAKRLSQAIGILFILSLSLNAGDAKKPINDDALPDGALMRLGSMRWRHGEPITFIAVPDAKTLVTATHDSVLRLWDRETGKEIRRFTPPADGAGKAGYRSPYTQGLTRAALSKDGRFLAVAISGGPTIQVWDVESGKALKQITGPAGGFGAMAFTPDGKVLAVRTHNTDRTAYLYDTDSGKELHKLKAVNPAGKSGNISGGAHDGTGLAISPDGKSIALPELEYVNQKVSGSVTVFDIKTGKETHRTDTPTNGIAGIAFSPDSKTLVYNTHTALHVLQIETGKELRQLRTIQGANLVVYAPDGLSFAVKGRDNLVRVHDANTGDLKHTLGELPGAKGINQGFAVNQYGATGTDVAFTHDSKTLIIGGQQVPRFFDVSTGKERDAAGSGGHRGAVTALAVSSDGKLILSRGAEGTLRIWNATTGQETRQFPEPRGIAAMIFSPDARRVAIASNEGTVHLIDTADGKELRQFKAHEGTVATLAFSADGKRIATRGSYDGLLKVFDADKGTAIKEITYQNLNRHPNGGAVFIRNNSMQAGQPLLFSPDGRTLATFVGQQQFYLQGQQQNQPDTNCLRFFDIATGNESRQIEMPQGRVINHLAYSRDGRLLFSENLDKTVSVWEVASGQERNRFGEPQAIPPVTMTTSFVVINGVARSGAPSHPVGVTIALSRDGSLIASPGPNHSIKVWDAALGKEVGSFKGHDGPLSSIYFNADGKTLLSGGNDTSVLVWDLNRVKREPRAKGAPLQKEEFAAMWTDLIAKDAVKAGKTIEALIAAPNAVELLKDRVQPAVPVDQKQVDQWLHDLDSSNFTKRAGAIAGLEKLGELAVPALQKALASQPSLETRRRIEPLLQELTGRNFTSEQIRLLRAIEVLDKTESVESRQLLQHLASGAPGALTTRQAQTALERQK